MVVDYDVIVIGAGIVGSCAAYHLSKAGKKTLIVDQFPIPHSRGSSHGHSRVTRRIYEHPTYADMMEESFNTWADIEKQTNTKLYINTGLVETEDAPYENIKCQLKNLHRLRTPHEILSNEEFASRFPEFVFSSESMKIFDPSGGILRSDCALNAVQKLCKIQGTVIIDECMVTSICPFVDDDGGKSILLDTNRGKLTSNTLVVCAGAWTSKLLRSVDIHIPTEAHKIWVYYLKMKNSGGQGRNWTHSYKGLPCLRSNEKWQFYVTPSMEYPGHIKLARHDGISCDPDNRDNTNLDPYMEEVLEFVESHLPELVDPKPSVIETCMYVMTPDQLCIVDKHPNHRNIVFGTGFSGTGFKLSPTVGRILCDLVLNKKTPYNIEPFSVNRFRKSSL